jgi:hypothetical protein
MAVMRTENMKDILTICVKKRERIKRERETERRNSRVRQIIKYKRGELGEWPETRGTEGGGKAY